MTYLQYREGPESLRPCTHVRGTETEIKTINL